jgi:hypothetical protein
MAEAVELRSVRALAEIRDRLGQFSSRVRSHAEAARDRIRWHSSQLEDLGRDRLDELAAARNAVDALDEEDDGWSDWQRLEAAQDALQEFREVASECHDARRRFEAAVAELAEREAALAAAALAGIEAKIMAADGYLTLHVPAASGNVGAKGGGGSSASPASASSPQAAAADDRFGRLPEGFAWVSLADLPDEDFVTDPDLFKKTNRAEMLRGVALLRDEILPMVNADPALNRDDIVQLDQQRGTAWTTAGFTHPDSLTTVWDAFLNPRREAEVVVVGRMPDGSYDVINGRHRLGIARELGMPAIPCKLRGAGA